MGIPVGTTEKLNGELLCSARQYGFAERENKERVAVAGPRATLYGWLDAVFWGSEAGALWHSNMESKTCRKEGGRIPAGS